MWSLSETASRVEGTGAYRTPRPDYPSEPESPEFETNPPDDDPDPEPVPGTSNRVSPGAPILWPAALSAGRRKRKKRSGLVTRPAAPLAKRDRREPVHLKGYVMNMPSVYTARLFKGFPSGNGGRHSPSYDEGS